METGKLSPSCWAFSHVQGRYYYVNKVRAASRQTTKMSYEVGPQVCLRPYWQILLASCLFTAILESKTVLAAGLSTCPTGFFNFGDSLTDTGSSVDAFPFTEAHEVPPYGENFFGKPSKRFSNGRLVPDFFSLAFGRKPLLQPYLQTGPYDYRFGVNFAYSGATASDDSSHTQFYLEHQINQFLRFRGNTESQWQEAGCSPYDLNLPTREVFENALYTFEIGGNDMIYGSLGGRRPSFILSRTIPAAMRVIASGAKSLYQTGARRFLFFQVPNAGCSTIIATLLGPMSELDSMGCVRFVNEYDQAYNSALRSTVEGLRAQFPLAVMDIFDYYSANDEILKNPTLYGFDAQKTMTACCGSPGSGHYNYNPAVHCGMPGSSKCANPDEYVNWDGVHFTENFYRTIAQFVLSGKYTDLGINYTSLCDLDYSLFGSSVTYEQAYPGSCKLSSQRKKPPARHQIM